MKAATAIPAQLQRLLDELEAPELTQARWRAMLEAACPMIDALDCPELVEPFLLAGTLRGFAR